MEIGLRAKPAISRGNPEAGSALVAALSLMLLLAPVGAFVAFQAQADSALLRGLRDGLEAFYAADAGIEHALAEIEAGTSLQSLLDGPDGIRGSGDDGAFPFYGRPAGALADPPLHYSVRVEAFSDDAIWLSSVGTAGRAASPDGVGSAPGRDIGGAQVRDIGGTQVRALVGRAPAPFSPAAVYAAAVPLALDLGDGGFVLSGLDHRAQDTARAPSGTAPPVAALGSADATLAAQMQASCDGNGIADCAQTASVDIGALATSALARPERAELSASEAGAATNLGDPATPRLTIVTGAYDLGLDVTGAGILLVLGSLRVTGTLTYEGVVAVLGGIVFESGSTVRVTGALWRAAGPDGRLQFRGTGAVLHGSAALGLADRAFPGLLPHAAAMLAWEEVL